MAFWLSGFFPPYVFDHFFCFSLIFIFIPWTQGRCFPRTSLMFSLFSCSVNPFVCKINRKKYSSPFKCWNREMPLEYIFCPNSRLKQSVLRQNSVISNVLESRVEADVWILMFDNMKCCKILWGSEHSQTILVRVPIYKATLEDLLTEIIKAEMHRLFNTQQFIFCISIIETHSKAHNNIHSFL